MIVIFKKLSILMYSSRNEITPLLFFQGLPLWYSILISRSSVSSAILCLLIHISSHIFSFFHRNRRSDGKNSDIDGPYQHGRCISPCIQSHMTILLLFIAITWLSFIYNTVWQTNAPLYSHALWYFYVASPVFY